MRVGSIQRGAEHSASERPSSSSVAKKLRKTISRERYLLTSTESSDEDSLFDNTTMGFAGAGRYSRSDYSRSQRRENFAGARSASDHWRWKFICLASAFTFIGLSYALCARLILDRGGMAASGNGSVAADGDHDLTRVQHLFNLSALYVGGYMLGLFIVGRLIFRTNPFTILLMLMIATLPATMFCINSVGNGIPHIASTPRWLISLHALAFGGVERAGLLFSHSRKGNYLRWIYAIYAILAIAALLGNSERSSGGERTFLGQWGANVSVEVRSTPSHHGVFKRDIHLFDHKPPPQTPSLIAATPSSNTVTAIPVAKNVTNTTTTTGKTSTEQPVFKSKTEENAFKRQEAEIKQKLKEGKLKADDTTATTTATTTTITPTPPATTTTTTLTTINPATTTPSTTSTTPSPTTTTTTASFVTFPPKSVTNALDGKSASKESMGMKESRSETSRSMSDAERAFTNFTDTSQLSNITTSGYFATMGTAPLYVLLISLLIPATFGLSCCLLGRPLSADTQLVEAMRLCEQDAGPNEPCSCGILSALLWLLHSSLESLAIAFIPLVAYSDGTAARMLNFGLPWEINFATIYWALAVLTRLFFAFRPLSATSSKTIHNFYILSIVSFAIVHFVLPSPGALRDALTSAITGLLISVIPLLLYSWQFTQLQTHPLVLSRRFLASSAFGKLLLPLIATLTTKWKRDSSTTAGSTIPLAMGLVASCYFLFMLLSAVVSRVKRQQQISTLCSDLNGRSSGGGGGKKTKTGATNGQYKSLLAEMGADGESSSGTDVELEMSETGNAHIV